MRKQSILFVLLFFLTILPLFSQKLKVTNELRKQAYELFEALNSADNPYFKEGGLTNDELISFGCLYANNHFRHINNSDEYKLPAHYIDSIVWKFFARKLQHHSIRTSDFVIKYKKGCYLLSGSDAGEMGKLRVTSFTKISDNKFVLIARFYLDDDSFISKKLTLSQLTENNNTRFILLAFNKVPDKKINK